MKRLCFLLLLSSAWAQSDIGQTYVDSADQDYHSNISPNPPSSQYVDPKTRHLRQLYRQYTRRAFEYRGLSEKYSAKDKSENQYYAKLAEQYEQKAMQVAQELQDLETGGLNPPVPSERVERRRVSIERARIKSNEKEQVPCSLQRRIATSTWQGIPSSTGIGKFPNRASSTIYPGCEQYAPRHYNFEGDYPYRNP